MDNIYIICIDDQPEVLNSVMEDLVSLEEKFMVEECESAQEAQELMESIIQKGDLVGVVISDHVMPGKTGVDFLSNLNQGGEYPHLKKVLLTGLATHEDTIEAINQAEVDYYVAKPWKKDHLLSIVKKLLTEYILDSGIDYQDYIQYLDQEVLFNKLKERI